MSTTLVLGLIGQELDEEVRTAGRREGDRMKSQPQVRSDTRSSAPFPVPTRIRTGNGSHRKLDDVLDADQGQVSGADDLRACATPPPPGLPISDTPPPWNAIALPPMLSSAQWPKPEPSASPICSQRRLGYQLRAAGEEAQVAVGQLQAQLLVVAERKRDQPRLLVARRVVDEPGAGAIRRPAIDPHEGVAAQRQTALVLLEVIRPCKDGCSSPETKLAW